ncbi:MAG: protein-L-isoaspartate(D-aspartate) O-methyltransferase [bacterium]|nr:protein-L-isoaspartate(D-aspartate) O-methyltransferase [bacterium]
MDFRDYRRERDLMVEEQIIRRGIRDESLIAALRKVPRHQFVAPALKGKAYDDYPLPIGESQTISQPFMIATMIHYLNLTGTEKLLEIGTGSGYQTALLAEMVEKVYSLERLPRLAQIAQERLNQLGYKNILITIRDGTCGLPEFGPYDRIIVAAGSPEVPSPLVNQLNEGGILVIPVGDRFAQTLLVIEKREGEVIQNEAGGCVFVPLVGKYGWKT